MTNEQILSKVVSKARKNGYELNHIQRIWVKVKVKLF